MDIKKLETRNATLNNVAKKNNAYQNEQSKQAVLQGSTPGSDTVTVSRQSKTLLQAAKVLDQDSSARREKIAALKDKVESGEYSVSSKDVASSIVPFLKDGGAPV